MSARKKLSLGEKIALAASGGQEDEFPEDIEYETAAKVVDEDEEYDDAYRPPVRSSLRTKNVQLLDEVDTKYAGSKVSRRVLAKSEGLEGFKKKSSKGVIKKVVQASSTEDEGIDDDEEVSEDEDDEQQYQDDSGEEEIEESDGREVEDEEEEDENREEEGGESSEEDEDVESGEEETAAMQTLNLRDKEAEIEKGKATLNQIRIWDSLLEVRIRLQKILIDSNRLPPSEQFEELLREGKKAEKSSELSNLLQKCQDSGKVLLHELIRLQNALIGSNSETKKAIKEKSTLTESGEKTKDPMDEEITSEEDEIDEDEPVMTDNRKRKVSQAASQTTAKKMKLEDFISVAEEGFKSFIPYRNQTIQKWNDKTQFAGGKFNRKAAPQISTLKQIEQILSNKERLFKRTQVRRSNYSVIGITATKADDDQDKTDPEVFDDDDFYHQLLRELIERKASNVNDPVQLSHHWLELQKLRTKLKRKVDTKASKGRKIRYDVHSKLVNFMAPQDSCTMSSAAVKELFGSLFGKMKEW